MRPTLGALLLGLALIAGARAQTEPPGAPALTAETRAALLRKRAARAEHVHGELAFGPDLARYRSALEQGVVVYVEERIAGKERGTRVNHYYFENGLPFFYSGEVPAAASLHGGPTATAPMLTVVVEWNAMGQAVRAVRMEHYGAVKLDDSTLAGIRSRARLLAGLSATQWQAAHASAAPPAPAP